MPTILVRWNKDPILRRFALNFPVSTLRDSL